MKALQDTYLEYLKECVDKLCKQSKRSTDASRVVLSNNRNSANFSKKMKELVFTIGVEKAAGSHFTDFDGNDFLDISMGFGVHLFGHKVPLIEKAISDQLEKGLALGPIYKDTAQVAELLCELTGNERCAFFNSGTEAVMVALRLARAYSGKSKAVIFKGSYHGTFDPLLAMKSDPLHHTAISTVHGVNQQLVDNTIILDFGRQESLEFIAEHADEIAAVLTEPVQSRHLERVDREFLQNVREVTERNDICLVFDEVVTGFRTANGGAAEVFSIRPDLCTYGKALGGGLPIGVVAGKSHYLDYLDGGQWRFGDESVPSSDTTFVAGTFCHHPLAMATANATLQQLKEGKNTIQKELNLKTAALCKELNEFFVKEKLPAHLNNFASLFRFNLKGRGKLLYYALLKEGVYVWEGRTCFISTAHTEADLTFLIEKVKKCSRELVAAGFWSRKNKKTPEKEAVSPNKSRGTIVQGAIEVDGLLDADQFLLASRYLIASIPALAQLGEACSCEFEERSIPWDETIFNAAIDPTLDAPTKPFLLRAIPNETGTKTLIHIQAAKELCDGWSLILFIRELAKIYAAIEHSNPLPDVSLQSAAVFYEWLNMPNWQETISQKKSTLVDARTLHLEVPLGNLKENSSGVLFESLLSAWSKSLGTGVHKIGVPLAGQLLSRKPNIFGPCTAHIELALDSEKEIPELIKEASAQLRASRKCFKEIFLSDSKPLPIVFNMDNLHQGFSFSGKAAILYPINEIRSAHELVCNVSVLESDLLLSLKYAAEKCSANEAEKLLKRFAENIVKLAG